MELSLKTPGSGRVIFSGGFPLCNTSPWIQGTYTKKTKLEHFNEQYIINGSLFESISQLIRVDEKMVMQVQISPKYIPDMDSYYFYQLKIIKDNHHL